MKIYIDNVILKFEENDFRIDGIEYGMNTLFEKYPDLKGNQYRIKTFRKDLFLKRLPLILASRPNHPIHIIIKSPKGLDIYNEIADAFDSEPAAGGFVKKGDEFLMIRRLGKWDLPKGKIEKGEDAKGAAIREVHEECGVIGTSRGHLCDTYHMYSRKGKIYIKKTSWFLMDCIDDSKMHGQEEEGITEVNWFGRKMLETNLIHSYGNIEDVFLNYLRLDESKAGTEETH